MISGLKFFIRTGIDEVAAASFDAEGNYLLTGGWEREFTCWDLRRMDRAFTVALNSYD